MTNRTLAGGRPTRLPPGLRLANLAAMIVWLIAFGATLVLVLAGFQLLVPMIAARRIAQQLVAGGGEVEVTVKAFPATKLLRREGDRLRVDGQALELGMSREGGGLSTLDGFTEVSIHLTDFHTGPFEISYFQLSRRSTGPYVMRTTATTSGASLIDYGGSQGAGFGLAPTLGALARQAPLGGRRFPLEVEVELASEAGLLTVVAGSGTIAGYAAGPIAASIAAAVARRLELDY